MNSNTLLDSAEVDACESIADFRSLLESKGIIDSAGSAAVKRKWMERPEKTRADLWDAYQAERAIVGRSEAAMDTMRRVHQDFPNIKWSVAERMVLKGFEK